MLEQKPALHPAPLIPSIAHRSKRSSMCPPTPALPALSEVKAEPPELRRRGKDGKKGRKKGAASAEATGISVRCPQLEKKKTCYATASLKIDSN